MAKTSQEIADLLFHDQRHLHPGHVLGKRRCQEIVEFVFGYLAAPEQEPQDA